MAVDISESSWKAFAKKQKRAVELDDKELLKALARFDKTSESKPELRVEALKDIAKEIPQQVTALLKLKKQLGDKPFGIVKDELYAILGEAEALQKKAPAAQEAAEAADDEEDEDSAPGALVNPKLLFKQLSMCRKDPERTMKFAFVDAKGKEQPAMLAMHPRMSGRALFAKLQAAAGVKTGAYGSAWVDGMGLMLQLDGFKIAKAVLWNADGTVFEQDELDEEADDDESATNAGDPLRQAYEARMAALHSRTLEALQAQRGDSTRLRSVAEFAREKAGAKNYDSALKALDSLEKLLAAGGAEATPAPGGGGAFSKVQFEKIHIDWNSRKQDIKQRLRALHAAIVEDWDDPVATTAAANLEKVLAHFNEGLGDTPDALRNSTTVAARNDLAGKAGEIADRYLAYLDSNPLVAHVEDNPFDVAVNARETLGGPLRELRGELAKLGAGATA
jgi:hypothetical protein